MTEMRDDIQEIKSGQRRVISWIAGLISSLVVGGLLGYLFQK